MEINSVNASQALNSTQSNSEADEAASLINADFQAFLQLLTAQMENQDPLNPMSSEDLATQLATFSGVEQQVRTNQLLEDMVSGSQLSNIGQIAGWIGLEARADMPVYYDGDPVSLTLDPPNAADRVMLVVTNEDGLEVRRIQVDATDEPMTFLGTDGNGTDLPEGIYNFTMEAYQGDQLIETSGAQVYADVREVFSRGSETWVTLAGGVQVNSANVQGVRSPEPA